MTRRLPLSALEQLCPGAIRPYVRSTEVRRVRARLDAGPPYDGTVAEQVAVRLLDLRDQPTDV
jgi:hypothetical protein